MREIRAATRNRIREHDLALELTTITAWQTANFERYPRRLPDLQKQLEKQRRKRQPKDRKEMSHGQMRVMVEYLNSLFGGEDRRVSNPQVVEQRDGEAV